MAEPTSVTLDNITLSPEETAMLTDIQAPAPKADDVKPPEEAPKDEGGEEEVAPASFTIDGTEYTEDDLKAAIVDHKNASDWKKANTAEAERIATLRKEVDNYRIALEPMVNAIKLMKSDGDTLAQIREHLIEDLGDENASAIDAALAFDANKVPNPFKVELDAATTRLAEIEAERAIDREKGEFGRVHPDMKAQDIEAVWNFTLKKFEDTGVAISFEDAFMLMDYEALKKKAETPAPAPAKPKAPKLPDSHGAKEIVKQRPTSLNDITEADIAEYKLFET